MKIRFYIYYDERLIVPEGADVSELQDDFEGAVIEVNVANREDVKVKQANGFIKYPVKLAKNNDDSYYVVKWKHTIFTQ